MTLNTESCFSLLTLPLNNSPTYKIHSGFTALTEKYCAMATTNGTSGTDKLSAILNDYIGMIVDGKSKTCLQKCVKDW